MEKMIAYCGLNCYNCAVFLATKNDDDVAREKTAAMWAEQFGFDLKPEDINCDGCLAVGGRMIGFCQNCSVRHCGSQKELENCTLCDEHEQCEKLISFHKLSPGAKSCFEKIKKSR